MAGPRKGRLLVKYREGWALLELIGALTVFILQTYNAYSDHFASSCI